VSEELKRIGKSARIQHSGHSRSDEQPANSEYKRIHRILAATEHDLDKNTSEIKEYYNQKCSDRFSGLRTRVLSSTKNTAGEGFYNYLL
jgi:hypothetical protein